MRDEIEKMNPMANGQAPTYPCANMCHFGFLCDVGGRECGRTDVAGRDSVNSEQREIAQHSARRERERFVVWELSIVRKRTRIAICS